MTGSGLLTWSGPRKINNDNTVTDQWNPSVAVNPAGTMLFVGYYSRQEDPNNGLIKAYGAKANIVNGLASASFTVAPVSTTAFPPLFAGTSTPVASNWLYDPVWPQTGVFLESNAVVVSSNPVVTTDDTYIHFMADDYTWASADGLYFYFAWCDRSETVRFGINTRKDANIRLGKVAQ